MQLRRLLAALALAAGLVLWGTAAPAMGDGDYNDDGTIDLADYAEFPDCMGGPDGGLGVDCDVFDFDSDGDVDAVDFAGFQEVFGTSIGVVIETVTIGNPGNPGEWSGAGYGGYGPDRICGAVDYVYNIGKYEITARQYTEFLNAMAATDTYGLYSTEMSYGYLGRGCRIERSGEPGDYTYSVAEDWADRPVNYVSWADAARFANWLHNGQPTGDQDLTTTEDGSYFLDGEMDPGQLLQVWREPDATWAVPSEDEWYKAAYHYNDGVTGNYFDYPTSNDLEPSNDLIDPDPGNNATFYHGGHTIGWEYYRTEVGAHENSESPYGTFDQGGNVWEWIEARPEAGYQAMRGGSFYEPVDCLHAAWRYGNYGGPTYHGFRTGFRVVDLVVAPPSGMVPVPAGEFEMGDSFGEGDDDELPVHDVHLDAYYIDVHEVTNQQYADALNWAWAEGGLIEVTDGVVYKASVTESYCDTTTGSPYSRITWDGATFGVVGGKEDHPMVKVSWYGAVAFCNWRSAMDGRTLCYDLDTWTCDFDAGGYRLPTEAEWEKAAGWDPVLEYHFRFGEHSDGCGENCLDGQRANYENSGDPFETGDEPYTTPVGYYDGTDHGGTYQTQDAQSYYGCRDMSGNVREWCNDWYDASYYGSSPYDNPAGPASGTSRVIRGGLWLYTPNYLRSANRDLNDPDWRAYGDGFRCVAGAP
jgi:sulfatase modifying factor 1